MIGMVSPRAAHSDPVMLCLVALVIAAGLQEGLASDQAASGSGAAGCPEGWTPWSRSCYLGLDGTMTGNFSVAQSICSAAGSRVLMPGTECENAFVNRSFVGQDPHGVWIACSDAAVETSWVCTEADGSQVSYRRWEPGQPDDDQRPEDQDLAFFITTNYKNGQFLRGYWGDVHADFTFYVVCERPRQEEAAATAAAPATPPVFCLPSTGEDGRPPHGQCLHGHSLATDESTEKEREAEMLGQRGYGPLACARRCADHPLCRSFNVQTDALGQTRCGLNNATRAHVPAHFFQPTKGCAYFEMPCPM